MDALNDLTAELIRSYNELNAARVDELAHAPSPLEFMRYVARNRPFVLRGGAAHWRAARVWSADYLADAMGARLVDVAVTPYGYESPASSFFFGKKKEGPKERENQFLFHFSFLFFIQIHERWAISMTLA